MALSRLRASLAAAAAPRDPADNRPLFDNAAIAQSDTATIDAHIQRADFVLITHTHYDHALDAPWSVYEMHPGSWRRDPSDPRRVLGWRPRHGLGASAEEQAAGRDVPVVQDVLEQVDVVPFEVRS